MDKVPVATVTATGFRLGYVAVFVAPTTPASGPVLVLSDVTAYTSAQAAQANLAQNVSDFGKPYSGPNFAAGNLSGLGDEAHEFNVDQTDTANGSTVSTTLVGIVFRRGSYIVTLFGGFVKGTKTSGDMVAQATELAKIVDGRIQAQTVVPAALAREGPPLGPAASWQPLPAGLSRAVGLPQPMTSAPTTLQTRLTTKSTASLSCEQSQLCFAGFGTSVALDSAGRTALIGACDKKVGKRSDAGAAYVFSSSEGLKPRAGEEP